MSKIIFDSGISLDGFFAGENRSPSNAMGDNAHAIHKARRSAKEKDIRIQGGANTIQQFLNAALVDEFFIRIAPVFLGSGIRLFDGIDKDKDPSPRKCLHERPCECPILIK
jgi:dihydrofolate reductase